jgi:flagellar biosynthesis/type III secretory pathway chaperone
MANDVAFDLLQVLQDERQALLAANLEAIEPLILRKEAALASLATHALEVSLRERVDQALRHNHQLLLAVRDGLAQTLDVLRGVTNQAAALTYGPDGQKKLLQDHGLGLSRKF